MHKQMREQTTIAVNGGKRAKKLLRQLVSDAQFNFFLFKTGIVLTHKAPPTI